jgi:Ca-activated chloride channel family protein
LANEGITDLEELARHARELAVRGVSTSTFGVGEGFNEHLLEAMSDQGGGNFYYIETPAEIPALFGREFKELAAVTAREVEIVLELPPQVHAQLLGGWRVECSPGQMRIFVGDLYSGRQQEVYVKLLTPPAGDLSQLSLRAKAFGKGEGGQQYESQAEAALRYAPQAEAEAAPSKRDMLERFARVDLAETANEALKLERRGENEKANRLLEQSIEANRPYVAPSQADDYHQLSERMKQGMDEADRKQSHYNSYNQKRRREP